MDDESIHSNSEISELSNDRLPRSRDTNNDDSDSSSNDASDEQEGCNGHGTIAYNS